MKRSLKQKDQNDGVCLRRLDEMTARMAEGANSLLSRQGGRVGDAPRQVGSALLPPHMDPQRIKGSFGDKDNVGGWQDLVKVAEKDVSGRGSTGRDLRWRNESTGACGNTKGKCSGRLCPTCPWAEQRHLRWRTRSA